MATFSSLPPHRKRPLDNPSGPQNDGCTSKQFEMVSEEEEYRWSHPVDIAKYANENSEKFIPDKDVKEAILLKLSRPEINKFQEVCFRTNSGNRVSGYDGELKDNDVVFTSGKVSENKESVSGGVQCTRDNINFVIQAILPARFQFRYLQQ